MNKCLLLITFLIFLSNCGYKIVNQNETLNFNVVQVDTNGDSRVNFYLKNKLNSKFDQDTSIPIKIEIESKKTKNIKEKNIKNEITKYNVSIEVNVKLTLTENNKEKRFTIIKTSDYDVGSIHSKTLNNEKKITKLLTEAAGKELIEKLKTNINDN